MPDNFQSNAVQLSSILIPVFDDIIITLKEENINIAPSQKLKVHTSIPLKYILSAQQYRLLLWRMSNKMVMDVTENHCTVSSRLYIFSHFETM